MIRRRSNPAHEGFTLLEVILATSILVIVLSIVTATLFATVRGWRQGSRMLDAIKHGDFAMNQLTAALNSTVYFNNPRKSYAFTFEKETHQGLPADAISFVTAHRAFLPEHSPLKDGPHRIQLYIDDDEDGRPGLFVQAVPALAGFEEYEDAYEIESHLVSRSVQGLEISLYDKENEEWTTEWENENSVPERIMITVYISSDAADEDPIIFSRILDIPVAESIALGLKGPSSRTDPSRPSSSPPPSPGGSAPRNPGAPPSAPPSPR